MKIGRYTGADGLEKLGVVVEAGGRLRVLDLVAATVARNLPVASTMDAFIDSGARGMAQAYETTAWALTRADAAWFTDEEHVPWLTPVSPRDCFAAGRNFGEHRDETAEFWKKQGTGFHTDIPMGFVKLARTLVPTRASVDRPPATSRFDYEVEAAAVIASPCLGVSEHDALKKVFGYTVFNDLSDRAIQRKEMANQALMVGKNLPGFGPLGPWILTADEVPDPSELELVLKVNGHERQRATCGKMLFSFAELIAYWSSMGLVRGDLIASGTPGGVASGRANPDEFYLRPGDTVHAEISQVGILETRIG